MRAEPRPGSRFVARNSLFRSQDEQEFTVRGDDLHQGADYVRMAEPVGLKGLEAEDGGLRLRREAGGGNLELRA